MGCRTGNADRSRGEAWRGSWPSSLPPQPRTPTLHSLCRRDPTHTRLTKYPKSLQAWNSPICLLEQQLSHESKHPKLLNVRLQFLALALALVTLLRLLSEPRPLPCFYASFPPVRLTAHCLPDITACCEGNYFEVIPRQGFSLLSHAPQLERNPQEQQGSHRSGKNLILH